MRIEALLLAGLGFLGAAVPTFAQEGDTAAQAEAASESAAESAAAAPAASTAGTGVDVDDVIAKYNAGEETPRTFTAEEREWIGRGLEPGDVDAFRTGHASIVSADEQSVFFIQDGEEREISSNPKFATRPVAPHIAPFATEIEEGNRSFWLPKAASSTAESVDAMFNFIMWTSYIFTALIGILMVWFCIKYRRRPGVRADQSITHNTPIEIVWSVLPTILVGIMFWGGYTTFLDMRTPPPDAMTVKVNAYQWGWNFTYPNGVESPAEFHVPANTPVKMLMTSNDVLHSFHLPAFRQKSDILPNRYTNIWFESGEPATYRVYCSEYCGKSHSDMYAKLVVDSPEDYEKWLVKAGNWMVNDDGSMKSPLEIGALTYSRRGCKACHSINGRAGTAPTFAGLWGLERKFTDGTSRIADEEYINQSIRLPHSQLVEGYGPQMNIYNPMLPEEQISGIIEYIKSLKDVPRID